MLAAEVDALLGVARLQVELARGLGHLLEHELRVEDHAIAVDDLLAGGPEGLDRLVEQELDSDLRGDPPPAAVEHRHGVLAEDLVARHRVDEHSCTSQYGLTSGPARAMLPRMELQFQPTWNEDFHVTAPAQGTQSIDRAGEMLARLLDSEEPMSLRDLAEAADLPKSTASRLLTALERHGLVHQAGERGKLEPGPAILRFAHRGGVERHLVELAHPALEAVAEISGETVNLSVPTPNGVDHLAQVDGRHFLGAGQWVGRRVDFHCTANGKVFLAFGAAELPPGGWRG